MKNYTFYSNSSLRFKIILILAVLYMLIFYIACPKPPKAKIRITVDRTPILMKWNKADGLWYLNPNVTFTETAGVGINIKYIRIELMRISSGYGFELVTFNGGRVDAFKSMTYKIEKGTSITGSTNLRISIIGTDDSGYDIKNFIEPLVDYVD